ncbi:protein DETOXIFICATION 18-like [Macadamia integrifolia]|uniref:protein DETOXIFICATION 18-like n=1 Tax=Macadamia integrifolia TaxID=60698 RepID=UPI001C4F5F24|nr:protein DETOXIFICATION 18-like [Macadamia integrifolia]XP_042491912.1 protein DETOXIFICATION 18-like [Macadamia integrifolia]
MGLEITPVEIDTSPISATVTITETSNSTTISEHHSQRGKTIWRKVLDVKEAKKQVSISVPMIITNLSFYLITLVSVMFAGRLGQLELAGSTLGNSWATVTGIALTTGLSGALETLCGQAYGANAYRMLGIYLQSSAIISFIFSVVASILWFFSEPILVLLHQDPQVAQVASIYLKCLIPGLFAYGFLQCILRFLQTQSVVKPLIVCSLVPLGIHIGLTYLLVHLTPLGFKGAPVAAVLSLWLSVFMLAFYLKYSVKFKLTLEGFSMESIHHLLPNMKLALSSAVMVCLEFGVFELLVLLAGLMPNSETKTSLIALCVITETVSYMLTSGLSAAVSTRVSNEIGAGNISHAKKAMIVTIKLSVVLGLTISISLIVAHNLWVSFFSNSYLLKDEFASITPLLAISMLLDSAQGILSGVARGCGWQHLAALTNFAAFYIIGTPISVVLGFKAGLYTKGLWIGLICGLYFQCCILLVITFCNKWTQVKLSEH